MGHKGIILGRFALTQLYSFMILREPKEKYNEAAQL